MKRAMMLLGPAVLLAATVGCDETMFNSLPAGVQAAVSSFDGLKLNSVSQPAVFGDQDRAQLQDRLHLMDGSCDGDGSQNQNGGGNGGSGSGDGGGDQQRLRDGSCDGG